MKKFFTEINFRFRNIMTGPDGLRYIPLEEERRLHVRTVQTRALFEKLPESGDTVKFLTDEQLLASFQESENLFENFEELVFLFNFEVERCRGYTEKTPGGAIRHQHANWVSLLTDMREMDYVKAEEVSNFMLCQLIRAGAIDKIRFLPKHK